MSNKIILTQNLYAQDEVILALLTALLRKQDLAECYFWWDELCAGSASTAGSAIILWQIYYDFYYELNPTIVLQRSKHMLKQLFYLPASPSVFLLCQANPKRPRIILGGCSHGGCSPTPPIEGKNGEGKNGAVGGGNGCSLHSMGGEGGRAPLGRFLKKKNHHGVCYFIKKMLRDGESSESIVKALCDHFQVPYIDPLHNVRDDCQYVMAVYARMAPHTPLVREKVGGVVAVANYIIPSIVGAFKLQRWQVQVDISDSNDISDSDEISISLSQKLAQDPIINAMMLSMSTREDHVAVEDYINARLKVLTSGDLQISTCIPDDVITEQQVARESIIAFQAAYHAKYLEFLGGGKHIFDKHIVFQPQIGIHWIQAIFGSVQKELIEYKLLDNLYSPKN